jgi:hypothetical protein
MKPSEIKVGKTYCNRGAGRTQRKVLEISIENRPDWYGSDSNKPPDDEHGVLYEQMTTRLGSFTDQLFLSSFAAWAGREVD